MSLGCMSYADTTTSEGLLRRAERRLPWYHCVFQNGTLFPLLCTTFHQGLWWKIVHFKWNMVLCRSETHTQSSILYAV
jgi:hypothetical protein